MENDEDIDKETPSMNDVNLYVKLFIHWDESFWTAAYVFLVVQGALIAALTQLIKFTKTDSWLVIAFIFSLFGFLISIFMLIVLNRKITYIHGSEALLQEKFRELYKEIRSRQTGKRKFSGAKIMHTYLPILFCSFWFIAAVLSILRYICY